MIKNQMYNKTYWVIPYNVCAHWMLLIIIRPKCFFQKASNINEKFCLLMVDSLSDDGFTWLTNNNMKVLQYFMHYAFKKEMPEIKLGVIANELNSEPKINLISFQQPNLHDCGMFVCINAKLFLLSVIRDGNNYTFDKVFKLPKYFNCLPSIYNNLRLIELRQAAIKLLMNMVLSTGVKKKKNCNNIFFKMVNNCFLSVSELIHLDNETNNTSVRNIEEVRAVTKKSLEEIENTDPRLQQNRITK